MSNVRNLNLGAAMLQRGKSAAAPSPDMPVQQPLSEMALVLTLDQVSPNPINPRKARNSKYDEIKESVRARGLDTIPKVTRDPDGDDIYIFSDGGNTRYLFMSTLHTKSAIGALRRMEHFGVDRHLLADASLVTGLVAQRLVPLLCQRCRIPWSEKAGDLPAEIRTRLETYCQEPGVCRAEDLYFRNPEGCEHCRRTLQGTDRVISRGITGRTAVAEVMRTDERLMQLWLSHGPAVARQHWVNGGGITRRRHLLQYLAAGLVDPLEGDLICPLDEDELMACEVPDA